MSEKGTTAMEGGFVPLSFGANTLTPEGMEHLIPDSGTNRCPMRDSAPHPPKKRTTTLKKRIIIVKKENTHETTT